MAAPFNLETHVQFLKSVGPARARALDRLGIMTVGDLLSHYPRRYFDRSATVPIGRARPGTEATVLGEVLTAGDRSTRTGGSLLTVSLGDDSGVLFCVWFNQKYLKNQFRPGRKVMASGLVQRHQGRLQLAHPDFEILDDEGDDDGGAVPAGLHTGRLVPVYGLTSGIGQHWLRALVFQSLERLGTQIPELLPAEMTRHRGLPSRAQALRDIHFPADQRALESARRRLVFEELFTVQLLMALRREHSRRQSGLKLEKPGDLTKRLVDSLPYQLTRAQRRVLGEILADLRSGNAMHRLLQGDVGSGKTLVALISALFAVEQGYQSVVMAPTEVLALQHGVVMSRLCTPLGVNVETLTGSTPAAKRRAVLEAAAAGEVDLLVGTHAVLEGDVRLPKLALAVVDEQHRFGVRQRGKSATTELGTAAHVLVMSATPIPRSLGLTLYGDLDLSLIDEMPVGRIPIETKIARDGDEDAMWEECRREVARGRQVYVIYPVIEETEGQDLKAATVECERMRHEIFPGTRVELLHGKMKSKDKQAVMAAFTAGEAPVLVATTVVEVGVDVPNATAMVIHNPERFGLAQLHQLRGRIGRGKDASRCWLLCDRFLSEDTWERVKFFSEHADGFALAEEDLRLRGPGDAWGVRQHGAPGFRLANPVRDAQLAKECRDDVEALLRDDPKLASAEGRALREALAQSWASAATFMAG
jgi:ATP-dependent DNA helicase RecG